MSSFMRETWVARPEDHREFRIAIFEIQLTHHAVMRLFDEEHP